MAWKVRTLLRRYDSIKSMAFCRIRFTEFELIQLRLARQRHRHGEDMFLSVIGHDGANVGIWVGPGNLGLV